MSHHPTLDAAASPRPKSAVSTGVGVVGLFGLFAWVGLARWFGMDGPWSALMAIIWCGLPMVVWSVLVDKVHRNPTTGLDWSAPPRPLRDVIDISLAKLTGLWATWAAIAAVYCIFRFYWRGNYLFSMEIFGAAVVPLLVLSIPYIFWLDRRMVDPKDGAWHLGTWLLQQPGWQAEPIFSHLRSWAVKGFFIAFMFSIVPGSFGDFIRAPLADLLFSPARLAMWLIGFMFVIDIAFATVGYVLTLRPLDSHIRSANPLMAGWVAALICYPPFMMLGHGTPLDYHPGTAGWVHWTDGMPVVQAIWGAVLVGLTGIYAWATMAYGLRFSNLTYRGVMTHGPYALTKHPAYLAKNCFWWLETVPFLVVNSNPVDAIRNTVIMVMVSCVYYWRAKTEEAHLRMEDPAYDAYASWMERRGLITSRLSKITRRRSR